MARNIQLLLVENVDNTGIVGDVVTVRKGYARNFLMPRGLAIAPSEERVKELAGKRADALRQLAELRKQREALIEKLNGQELVMIRSCNDLGILYGAVTQHEIATELDKTGFHGIRDREVRLGQPVKRIGDYEITVKFEAELEAHIKLHVKPDRELPVHRANEAAAVPTAEGGEPVMEKRTKDKSAKFDTKKPGEKDEADAGADEKPAAKGKKHDAKAAEEKPSAKGTFEKAKPAAAAEDKPAGKGKFEKSDKKK
ncbi:MAG: 50S ribosomal protein L9 [Phycisphaerales bacterium]